MVFVYQDPINHIHKCMRRKRIVREGPMKPHRPKRLSVRVPTIGWEAYVSTERLRNTRAKVGNVSADGAYLITSTQYKPASKVKLSIKSPVICFKVTGMVVRNDPYGMAVRFLDHSESTRSSLMRVISNILAEKGPIGSIAAKTPVCSENKPKGKFELEQECSYNKALAAKTPVGSESKTKRNFELQQECFYSSALAATAPCSEVASLAERNDNEKKDSGFAISLAETQSTELLKVFLNHNGKATVKCLFCAKCHYTQVPKQFHNKPVRTKCECGKSFPVLFDSRKHYRKEVRFPGEYWDRLGQQDLMTVTTLSLTGAGFEAGQRRPSIDSGEIIEVNFLLENHKKIWIKSRAVVKRVNGNQVGIEFTGMDEHQRKCIGFYLMA